MTHSRYFNLLWEFKRQKCTSNTHPLRPWHDVHSWPSYFWTLISCLHHFLTEAASSSSTQVPGIDRFEFFPFGWFILAEDPEPPQVEDLSVVLPPAMLVPLPEPFPWNGHLLVTLFPSPLSVPLRDFCVAHIHFHGGASSDHVTNELSLGPECHPWTRLSPRMLSRKARAKALSFFGWIWTRKHVAPGAACGRLWTMRGAGLGIQPIPPEHR